MRCYSIDQLDNHVKSRGSPTKAQRPDPITYADRDDMVILCMIIIINCCYYYYFYIKIMIIIRLD